MARNTAKAALHFCVLMGSLCGAAALAQDATTIPAPPATPTPAGQTAPAAPPFRIHALTRAFTIAPDGSWRETTHSEVQIGNAAALAQLAQFALTYDEEHQTLEVTNAYTLKADGRKEPVAAAAIIERSSPTGNIMLTTQKQKVIVYPDVAVGDTIVYDAVFTGKPQIQGLFGIGLLFPRNVVIDGETTSVSAPKSSNLHIDATGVTAQKTESGDTATYTVTYANATLVPTDTNPMAPTDYQPRLWVSTFASYDALAAAYAPMVAAKLQVTPEVQKTADGIVAGTTDKREQARKLYDWINAHIRYVAITMGTGGIIPHDAASVIANGYGDCKDQATLYVDLLKAEKIDARLVLIHSGNAFALPKVPAIDSFDHMITYIPSLNLYADTTSAGLVPFGKLGPSEYGKSVAIIGDSGKVLRQIPLADAKDDSFTYTLNAKFDDAGHDTSSSSLTATGSFLEPLRVIGRVVQQDTQGKLATSLFTLHGTPKATGTITAPPDISTENYQITTAYQTPGVLIAFVQNRGFTIPDSLRLVPLLSASFFGQIFDDRFKTADALPCHSGRGVDDETLELPASRHLQHLPDDKKISTSHMTYASHWSQDGNTVHVHREVETRFDQAVCTNPVKDEVLTVAQSIKTDLAAQIALVQVQAQ
jgi:hypothetical protein